MKLPRKTTLLTRAPAMAPPPADVAAFDPNASYSAFVREALIDAILDSSGMLKLQDNEHLTERTERETRA